MTISNLRAPWAQKAHSAGRQPRLSAREGAVEYLGGGETPLPRSPLNTRLSVVTARNSRRLHHHGKAGCGCVPIKLYRQRETVGQTGPGELAPPTPDPCRRVLPVIISRTYASLPVSVTGFSAGKVPETPGRGWFSCHIHITHHIFPPTAFRGPRPALPAICD